MPKDHSCAHPRCDVALPGYLLACRPHWLSLPAFLRAEISRAWYRRQRHPDRPAAALVHVELVAGAVQLWLTLEAA